VGLLLFTWTGIEPNTNENNVFRHNQSLLGYKPLQVVEQHFHSKINMKTSVHERRRARNERDERKTSATSEKTSATSKKRAPISLFSDGLDGRGMFFFTVSSELGYEPTDANEISVWNAKVFQNLDKPK